MIANDSLDSITESQLPSHLFQVEVEIMSRAVLHHRAERVGVDLEGVVVLDDPRVVQRPVDVVLPQRVLDVVGLLVVLPVLVQLVDFAGDVPLLL